MEEENEFTNEEILASLEEKPEEQAMDAATPEATEGDVFQFKSLDDLMGHNLKYTANGKEVEEPISAILKRASQGYHYAQQMGDLNTQKSEWQKQVDEASALRERYQAIDDHARQNPEWFDHWNNAYQNRDAPLGNNSPEQPAGFDPTQITSLIDQKLQPFQDVIQQQQAQAAREREEQENAMLDSQVKATQEEFADIDFAATSPETGMSLEHQVYQFMVDNNISDFNKAYKMMDYENIMARQIERAKADMVKQEQLKRKQGIVAETTGQAKDQPADNFHGLHHDQQQAMMLQHLEQLRSQQ
jgi:hypothetical protein